jgi:hypothetical protein
MKLLFPLKREKYITQVFGANADYYSQFTIGGAKLKGHEGVDYRAENGTQVVACDEGFCQEVLDQGKTGYGRYIKIIHGWGESVYAHLQEFKVKQGDTVKKGQVIALSDNTGNSTGPHLHFGIRINPYNRGDGWGGYSDPEPYLEGEVSQELDMPVWAKNLKPFFIEIQLKDDQIESFVREATEKKKILDGFISKWVQKLNLPEGSDLGSIEKIFEELLELEDEHLDLKTTCEQILGHTYETPKALREALRVYQSDINEVIRVNKELIGENATLRQKKVLDRYTSGELVIEVLKRAVERTTSMLKGGSERK